MLIDRNDFIRRASRIRLLLFDVDGVLTDGSVFVHADGSESKRFDIKDGTGIVLAERAGLKIGLLSGRHSAATIHRAAQLGISIVRQEPSAKLDVFAQILAAERLEPAEAAFMGDDLFDLPVLSRVGLSGAPADAVGEVIATVHWVSRFPGGRGAAREFIEVLLGARGQWSEVIRPYAPEAEG